MSGECPMSGELIQRALARCWIELQPADEDHSAVRAGSGPCVSSQTPKWRIAGSNRWPSGCQPDALPA